ncbi:1163_t:CDS:2 [Dentiscutata heterogama]|uniref:1163_t:CDS:1 n=1 Tax=Dentiscutata heterogama TaxID=1316150 RepID=A0ACA9MYK6_9GLOM|nr:1163_t:CDS:2 [Dentiscutata heterogama]
MCGMFILSLRFLILKGVIRLKLQNYVENKREFEPPTTTAPGYGECFGPITRILELVNSAFEVNKIMNARKLAIASASLMGLAAFWWENRRRMEPRILYWDNKCAQDQSLVHQQGAIETVDKYAAMLVLFQRLRRVGNQYSESTKVEMFVQGLRPDLSLSVQPFMPSTLWEAVERVRICEITIACNLVVYGSASSNTTSNNPYAPIIKNPVEQVASLLKEIVSALTNRTKPATTDTPNNRKITDDPEDPLEDVRNLFDIVVTVKIESELEKMNVRQPTAITYQMSYVDKACDLDYRYRNEIKIEKYECIILIEYQKLADENCAGWTEGKIKPRAMDAASRTAVEERRDDDGNDVVVFDRGKEAES